MATIGGKMVNDPDAFAVQSIDFTNRLAQLKASRGGDMDDKFQEAVAAWLQEQSGKHGQCLRIPLKGSRVDPITYSL